MWIILGLVHDFNRSRLGYYPEGGANGAKGKRFKQEQIIGVRKEAG